MYMYTRQQFFSGSGTIILWEIFLVDELGARLVIIHAVADVNVYLKLSLWKRHVCLTRSHTCLAFIEKITSCGRDLERSIDFAWSPWRYINDNQIHSPHLISGRRSWHRILADWIAVTMIVLVLVALLAVTSAQECGAFNVHTNLLAIHTAVLLKLG